MYAWSVSYTHLPDNYYSRLHIDTAKLASLLDEIDKINTGDKESDIIGRVYEYFLSKFALAEGKGKGEFYTPKCIVNLDVYKRQLTSQST